MPLSGHVLSTTDWSSGPNPGLQAQFLAVSVLNFDLQVLKRWKRVTQSVFGCSDHYQGITDNWRKGVIFCSETTARMVTQVLEVPPHFVVALPMDSEVEIDGCGVTLVGT